jgi:hypothetical protein
MRNFPRRIKMQNGARTILSTVKYFGHEECHPGEPAAFQSGGYPLIEWVEPRAPKMRLHLGEFFGVNDNFVVLVYPTEVSKVDHLDDKILLPGLTPVSINTSPEMGTVCFIGGSWYNLDLKAGQFLWGGLTPDDAWQVAEAAERLLITHKFQEHP